MSDKFDHIIRDHVDRHEYDIDPQEIWEGINKKTKKDKFGYWVWPLGMALVLFFSVSLFSVMDEATDSSKDNSSPISSLDLVKAETVEAPVQVTTNDLISKTNKTSTTTDSKPEFVSVASQKEIIKTINNDNLKENNLFQTTLEHKNTSISTADSRVYLEKRNAILSSQSKVQEAIGSRSFHILNPLALLAIHNVSIPNERHQELGMTYSKFVPSIEPLSNSRWAFSVRSGLSLINRNIEAISNQEMQNLISSTEQPYSNTNSELLIHYGISDNLSVSSGLSYQKMVDLFKWNGVLLTDGQGEILSLYDESIGLPANFTGLYYESIDRNITHYNQVMMIDLPINLEYAITTWKLKPVLSIGAAFSLHNTSSGLNYRF